MRVTAVREFHDRLHGKVREEGETFEATPERFEQLTHTKWGALVVKEKPAKKQQTKGE